MAQAAQPKQAQPGISGNKKGGKKYSPDDVKQLTVSEGW